MFRILHCDKDTYITNKYFNGVQLVSGNVGQAGSLDLFKIYGMTQLISGNVKIPQTELSRILLHFDLDPLRELVSNGKIDISADSFLCHLRLRDIYGGQPTPNNFTLNVFPLSGSFDEGFGKDTTYYADLDRCNFISASKDLAWLSEGCSLPCFSSNPGDYITGSSLVADTLVYQYFKTGEEDLLVDVTKIVSATLMGDIPDSGFRISYSEDIESNNHTYFVKRFGSSQSYDESKRPSLLVRFDDSIMDDSSNLYLDSSSNLFLYNYSHDQLDNLMSASFSVSGSNCLLLELKTEVSGVGSYSLFFTGSQYSFGKNYATGIYSAPVTIPLSDVNIKLKLEQSGSVKLTPIWQSLDRTTTYVTGSTIIALPSKRLSYRLSPSRYNVSAITTSSDYATDEDVNVRVNIFDENNPLIIAKKMPFVLPGLVLREVYYAIKDATTNEYIIPFDPTYRSTKVSSDSKGMYFIFNTSSLISSRVYSIDLMIVVDGTQQKYLNVSTFRVKNPQY
jgi:hypothetical protein